MPTVSLDYTFVHGNQEEDEEKGMPILVIKDEAKEGVGAGMVFAYVVPRAAVCRQKVGGNHWPVGPPRNLIKKRWGTGNRGIKGGSKKGKKRKNCN